MRPSPLAPAVHFFVCANRRDAASPLGPGCGVRGEAVYERMKAAVAARSAYQRVWVTQTACLGLCPKRGATVAIYPRQRIVTEVEPADADALFRDVVDGATP
jgi:(2Fe-2S) ferredoxin